MNSVVLLEVELWAMNLVRNNMSHKVKPIFVAHIMFLFPGFINCQDTTPSTEILYMHCQMTPGFVEIGESCISGFG